MKLSVLGILAALLLASCSNAPVKKNMSFDSTSKTGIIVFGLTLSPLSASPIVTFRKYDEETGEVSKKDEFYTGFSDQASDYEKGPAGVKRYFVLNLPAGNWLLECLNTNYNEGGKIYFGQNCFSEGTIAFTVKAGSAQYVGEYLFSTDQFKQTGLSKLPDQAEKAKLNFQEFKNISTPLELQKSLAVNYSCVKKMVWIDKYECDVDKMNVQTIESKPSNKKFK